MSLECEFQAPVLTHLETTKRSLEALLKVMSTAMSNPIVTGLIPPYK
jgi:hypothetical protein